MNYASATLLAGRGQPFELLLMLWNIGKKENRNLLSLVEAALEDFDNEEVDSGVRAEALRELVRYSTGNKHFSYSERFAADLKKRSENNEIITEDDIVILFNHTYEVLEKKRFKQALLLVLLAKKMRKIRNSIR